MVGKIQTGKDVSQFLIVGKRTHKENHGTKTFVTASEIEQTVDTNLHKFTLMNFLQVFLFIS